MATVAGNLFELNQFSGLKLLDLQLPTAFREAYARDRSLRLPEHERSQEWINSL